MTKKQWVKEWKKFQKKYRNKELPWTVSPQMQKLLAPIFKLEKKISNYYESRLYEGEK